MDRVILSRWQARAPAWLVGADARGGPQGQWSAWTKASRPHTQNVHAKGQPGTWATDFTDPANPVTIGWSDPPPLPQVTNPAGQLVNELRGAWSSSWYNNFIYESEITKGVHVLRLNGATTGGAIRLPHLNPQTQDVILP